MKITKIGYELIGGIYETKRPQIWLEFEVEEGEEPESALEKARSWIDAQSIKDYNKRLQIRDLDVQIQRGVENLKYIKQQLELAQKFWRIQEDRYSELQKVASALGAPVLDTKTFPRAPDSNLDWINKTISKYDSGEMLNFDDDDDDDDDDPSEM